MATLRPSSASSNLLASVAEPSSPLDAAENALSSASLFIAHGRVRDARMALLLAFSALHLASVAGEDIQRLSALARAAREADELVTEAMPLAEVSHLRAVG